MAFHEEDSLWSDFKIPPLSMNHSCLAAGTCFLSGMQQIMGKVPLNIILIASPCYSHLCDAVYWKQE